MAVAVPLLLELIINGTATELLETIQILSINTADLNGAELKLLEDFRVQFESMQDELLRMECFLEDQADQRDDNWIDEVRKKAHFTEDLLHNYLLKRESKPKGITLLSYSFKQRSKKGRIKKEIKVIKEKLREYRSRPQSYEPAPRPTVTSQDHFAIWEIVGLEDETEELLKELGDSNNPSERKVVSIVGMGGIGKSTLAWNAINHGNVMSTFDLLIWVSIPESFRRRNLQVKIVSKTEEAQDEETEEAQDEETEEAQDEETEEPQDGKTGGLANLCDSLRTKRYLVVLDEVWGPKHLSFLDDLLHAFPDDNNGSRILITTRMNDVPGHADSRSHPLRMKHMDDDKSWELFCKKASINRNNRNFQRIGKKIMRRCQGLPLSIVAMGSKFANQKTSVDWENAYKETECDAVMEEMLKRLETCYNFLTPVLRRCFYRLGFFPVNHTIPARKLTQLWVAEGLINKKEGESIEATAESYLDVLVEKNVVQPIEFSPLGRVKTCQIDNSLRELSIIKAKKEILAETREQEKVQHSSNSRHLSIYFRSNKYFDVENVNTNLRSLLFIVQNGSISLSQLEFICKKFTLLKVLHLEGMAISHLPNKLGELHNLRYLNLRNTFIDKLPPSMSNLKKLLTLDIRDNRYLRDLDVIKDMSALQNLYLPGFYKQLSLDGLGQLHTLKWLQFGSIKQDSLAQLTALRTLRVQLENFDIFLDWAKNLEHLKSLHLHPTFEISSLATEKLSEITSLTKLYIKGGVRELPNHEHFPPNLMQLTLDGSGLIPFPLMELAKLPKLSILRLRNLYIKDEKLSFSVDGFPRLKYLELLHLWNLVEFEFIKGATQVLKHIKISNCNALNSIPTGLLHLPMLTELHIDKMEDTFKKKIENEEHWDRVKQRVRFIKFTNTLKSYEDM